MPAYKYAGAIRGFMRSEIAIETTTMQEATKHNIHSMATALNEREPT